MPSTRASSAPPANTWAGRTRTTCTSGRAAQAGRGGGARPGADRQRQPVRGRRQQPHLPQDPLHPGQPGHADRGEGVHSEPVRHLPARPAEKARTASGEHALLHGPGTVEPPAARGQERHRSRGHGRLHRARRDQDRADARRAAGRTQADRRPHPQQRTRPGQAVPAVLPRSKVAAHARQGDLSYLFESSPPGCWAGTTGPRTRRVRHPQRHGAAVMHSRHLSTLHLLGLLPSRRWP